MLLHELIEALEPSKGPVPDDMGLVVIRTSRGDRDVQRVELTDGGLVILHLLED